MFGILQIPFVDHREFQSEPTGRIAKPTWSAPVPGMFLRGFGDIRVRRRGGASIAEESRFCSAREAVKFVPEVTLPVIPIFRRLFSDGHALVRFEAGFLLPEKYPPYDVSAFVASCLSIPVKMDGQEIPLSKAPPKIGQKYLRATTSWRSQHATSTWWIDDCEPLLLIEAEDWDFDKTNYLKLFKRLSLLEMPKVCIRYREVKIFGRRLAVWVVSCPAEAKSEFRQSLRRLRIYICRLHAEIECICAVLRQIEMKRVVLGKKGSFESESLQKFLDTSARWLDQKSYDGMDFEPVFRFAQQLTGQTEEGLRETVLAALDRARKTVITRCAQVMTSFNINNNGQLTIHEQSTQSGDIMTTKNTATVTGNQNTLTQAGRDATTVVSIIPDVSTNPTVQAALATLQDSGGIEEECQSKR